MGIRKLNLFYSLFNLQSTIHNPQSLKYFSLTQQKFLFVLALILLGLLYFRFYYQSPPPSSEEFVKESVVEVLGEVQNPGVYLFHNPPTLKEAIEKAGGLKETALFNTTSSSEILETGTLLFVEKEKGQKIKIKLDRMEANKLLVFSIPLDLNRVSKEDLCLIPEIGESTAQEIIAYREKRRGFRSVEELKRIKGIGEKKYQNLKDFLIVK
jgi:competence protein ComEA